MSKLRGGINMGRVYYQALNSALSRLGGPYRPRPRSHPNIGRTARALGMSARQVRRRVKAARREAKRA